jgi:hypothetical protein
MSQLPELTHILGQRVCVTDTSGQKWYGELYFVGTNDFFLSWGLHCTVNRTPGILIKTIMDIEILNKEFSLI